jgi:ATP/maltotriose-dependent transcriptional regulator MalT
MSKFSERIPSAISETAPYPNLTVEPLSKREREVLYWVASGASNREIGQKLAITESTVKRHIYNIFGKLNVRNRTQAVLWAIGRGVSASF